MPLKILRYIFATICLLKGIVRIQIFFSYSMNFWFLIIAASYFLAAYLFIAPLMGRVTFPVSWSEQKIAVLFSISSITAAVSFLNPWGFLAIALGIKLNAKEERGYYKIINKSLKIMVVIFIVVFVVALFAFNEMYSSIARMSDH